KLVLALHLRVHRPGRRPAEVEGEQLAAADFAHGLDHEAVVAGGQAGQRRLRIGHADAVLAGRFGGAADAIHRELLAAAAAPPPLAQVLQPLGAVLAALAGLLVPVGDVADDLALGRFDPDR